MKVKTNRSWKTAMFIVVPLILIVIVVAFFILKSGDDKGKKEGQGEKTVELALAEVKIDPSQPISTDIIRAIPVLTDPAIARVTFKFEWYVNGEGIADYDSNLLDKKYYKKGDVFYCQVSAASGEQKTDLVKSNDVRIGNAPPEVAYVPVENFSIPGRFSYRVKATDPDGDALTYRLIAPTNWAIMVDKDSGEVTWDIPDIPVGEEQDIDPPTQQDEAQGDSEIVNSSEPPKQEPLPQSLDIIIEIRDQEGAVTVHAIKLNLSKEGGAEKPE